MASLSTNPGRASALPINLLAKAVPMLNRAELAALTEKLLERLDEIDGNPDVEDDNFDQCGAGDDGCAPVAMHGQTYWGSDEH